LYGLQAHADCDPQKFIVQDIEKLNFSRSTYVAALSTLDSSRQEAKNKKYSGSAIIKGVPVNLSVEDAQAVAESVRQSSKFEFTQEEAYSYAKYALSPISRDMYKDCIESLNIVADIPQAAFTNSTFEMKFRWAPKYKAPQTSPFQVRAKGATIDGHQDVFDGGAIGYQDETPLLIERDIDKPLSIAIRIDGKVEIIYLPPKINSIAKLERRTATIQPMLADHGSGQGGSRKEAKPCVQRTSGILLKSTVVDQFLYSGNLSEKEVKLPTEDSSALEVCAFVVLKELPAGSKASNRISGGFSVQEAIIE